jgi:hypothetical protein
VARALHEDELGLRRPLGERLLEDLVGLVRLADAGVALLDLLQTDEHVAGVEEDDDAREPAEDCRLPMAGAPRSHPPGDVHRALHLLRAHVGRRVTAGVARFRPVLDDTAFHLGSLRWLTRRRSHVPSCRNSRETRRR